jgi:hypothetical protein
MAIQIIRNEDANAINFSGSSFPSYYNSSLTASLSQGSTTEIDVTNVISGRKEFFKIPFNTFTDATGSAFVDATACVDYINIQANIPRADLLRDSSTYTQGYLGLLSDFFFSGTPTTRIVGGNDVNEWIEVGFDVIATTDNRPVSMKEADAVGSVNGEDFHIYTNPTIVGGTSSTSVTISTNTLTFTSGSGFGITFEGSPNIAENDNYNNITTDVLTQDFFLVNPNDATDRAKITSYIEVVNGDRTITFDQDISGYINTTSDTPIEFITDIRNIITFKLNGLETTAFVTFEGAYAFEPFEDEGQLEARLLFQRRSGATPSTDFEKATLAGSMTQGSSRDYVMQPILTFFVGDTIDTEGNLAGTYRFQIKSSVPGLLKMRQLTAYINT